MMYATDKEILGYVPEYQRIADMLGPAARVLELGVLNGLGLAMLKDMYPQGIVAGVDSNPNSQWPLGTIKIISDQVNPALPEILDEHAPAWDLIVDDASHRGGLTAATYSMLWPFVSPGGFYIIEDWFIGLPLWPSTGCWDGAPVGSQPVADSYDPSLLQMVQDLLLQLDKPYCGACAPSIQRETDVESVTFRYGLAIVQKYAL